jgi:DNA-binding CsgD family transcriptional regulator
MINREAEREQLSTLLADARGGLSGALVVRGEPGVGKSTLLEFALSNAGELSVVQIAGVESEMDLSYAGLHRLLLPFTREINALPVLQGTALSAAFGLGSEPAVPAQRLLVSLATLTLLARVASKKGLLCVVDDAQWLDRESLEVLAFVGLRIQADGIVMLFGVREPSEREVPFDGIPSVLVRGLSPDHANALLASVSRTFIPAPIATQLVIETNGNPLALTELVDELTASELGGGSPLPQPLPLGHRLQARFLRQVQALLPESQMLLLAAAAEPSGDPDIFWRCAVKLGISPDGLEGAEASGLLVLRPKVAFRHPLVRSAVYGGASIADRRRVHGALADVTDQESDQDRWAWHRAAAAAGPNESVATALEESAGRSRSRGGHAAVASTLARAAELTPNSNRRAVRYLDAAEEALAASEPERAEELLERGSESLSDPVEDARAKRIHGNILNYRYQPNAVPALIDAARSLAEFDQTQARDAWLDALKAEIVFTTESSGATLLTIARSALSGFETSGPENTLGDLLLHGFATRLAIGYNESLPSLRRAISIFCDDRVDPDVRPPWNDLVAIAASDLVDDSARLAITTRLGRLGQEHRTMHNLAIGLLGQATIALDKGGFERAEALYAQCRDVRSISGQWWNKSLEMELFAWQGRDAETHEAGAALRKERAVTSVFNLIDRALLILGLGRGHYDEALASAKRLLSNDPFRYGTRSLPDVVEAAVRAGDSATASIAFERLSLRYYATATPLALGLVARSRALMETGDAAEAHFRDAVDRLERVDAANDVARAHLLYGEWLRRQKRRLDARAHLRIAHELFSTMGAHAFAERARIELQATGESVRKRSPASQLDLTPQERQIAELAGGGATNTEIASQMYLSSSTVDYHLKKVFRKLNITSRRQLAAALDRGN